jgi:hypothetical protein
MAHIVRCDDCGTDIPREPGANAGQGLTLDTKHGKVLIRVERTARIDLCRACLLAAVDEAGKGADVVPMRRRG